jgi:hypothetical protein
MANSKRKCGNCNKRFAVETMFIAYTQAFCSKQSYIDYCVKNLQSLKVKGRNIQERAIKIRHKEATKKLRTRTAWYDLLQTEVNKYVRNRDANKPCCTCGTTSKNIKYDAGHCFTRGSRPELRFNVTNIHKQCSVNCNQHGSGMRLEYQTFITDKYGPNHFEWLKSYHRPLSEEYPHWTDIEKEIQRYKTLNKIQNRHEE